MTRVKLKIPKMTRAQKTLVRNLMDMDESVLVLGHGETLSYETFNGERLHLTTVTNLINMKVLIPSGDGLFGTTQTYKLNPKFFEGDEDEQA